MLKSDKIPGICENPALFSYNINTENFYSNGIGNTLCENEGYLSQIIQANSIPTIAINPDHKITHWNAAMERLTGKTASEMVGRTDLWCVFYKKKRNLLIDLLVDNIPERKILKYYNEYKKSDLIENAYTGEKFFPKVGEKGKWLYYTAAPIRDIYGRIIGAIETVQDFTNRRKTEAMLCLSEDKFYKAFMFNPSVMLIISINEGKIIEVNDRFVELFGIEREEYIGGSVDKLRQFADQREYSFFQRKINLKECLRNYEIQYKRKSGKLALGTMSWEYISVKEKDCLLIMIEDITEIRTLEKEIITAIDLERQRIGRDLHDGLGQNLTCVSFLVQSLKQDMCQNTAEQVRNIEKIENLVKDAIIRTRNISKILSPFDIKSGGLLEALEDMAAQIENVFKISCVISIKGKRREFDKHVATNFYYIVREAINNAIKHGNAANILILIKFLKNNLKMIIDDDGKGAGHGRINAGMGLRTMKYRASLVGAHLAYANRKKGGFSIELNLTQ